MQFATKEEAVKLRECTSIDEGHQLLNELLTRVYNKAIEEALRKTPDLMVRLLVSQQAQQQRVKEFYESNPGFAEHRDIVQRVIAQVDADNPGKDYEFIFSLAVPLIKKQIQCEVTANMISEAKV